MIDGIRATRAIAALAFAALAGCASVRPDADFAAVADATRAELGRELVWSRDAAQREQLDTRVADLLAHPLGPDDAVQVALFDNRGLQAALDELGVAEADRVQASRLPNPGLSLARLVRGDEREIERGPHLDLARLIALPALGGIGRTRAQRVRDEATQQVFALAHATRRAWVEAVAAQQALQHARQVQEAADAGAELARRMAAAGNWNALNEARERSFAAEAAVGVARAVAEHAARRERLTRLLGLDGATAFTLSERLPDLPAELPERPDIEQRALTARLDVRAARLESEALAQQLGLTRSTRFVNVLELGVVRNSANDLPTQRGIELRLELPIFGSGDARLARAEARHRQSLNHAARVAIEARSQVREADAAWRHAYTLARLHRDELVPLARRISDENLLRYNAMLVGVFELLADARAQIGAVRASIAAQRDFWLADADLRQALVGSLGSIEAGPSGSTGPAAEAAPAASH